MQKAFITGISGFAGSHLAEFLLSKGYEVSGIVRPGSHDIKNLENIRERIHLFEADLLDFDAVLLALENVKPDQVYHLAAFPSPAQSFKDPASYLHNNIDAQLYLLEALKEMKSQARILIVSSSEVYGLVTPKDLPIDEQTPLRPVSPYGVSKIAQDFLALQYSLAYGMDIIRVRPFGHVGPRMSDQFAASAFAKKIAEIEKGEREPVLNVGNLESKRDLTDVRDVVRAYVLLMEKGKKDEVYNIGRGTSFKTKFLLDTLLSFSEKKIPVETDPQLLRPSDIPELLCDNKKLVALTKWKPEISIEKSLEDTLEYWRNTV